LKEFVAHGGALVHVLSDTYSADACSIMAEAGLMPKSIQYAEDNTLRAITEFDEKHPSFARFQDRENGQLANLPWQQRFNIGAQEGWKPLLTLDHGVPLAWEKQWEKGRVFLMAHPMNRSWTDAPRDPLFVPFVKGIFGGLTGLSMNQTVAREIHPGENERRKIGYYNMPDGTMDLITADGAESNVKSWETKEFCEMLGLPGEGDQAPAVATILASDAPGLSRPREWWPWIAAFLLLFLMMENIMAFRRYARNVAITV
jgi:hypothetical protein